MLLNVICAECGKHLGGFVVSGSEQTVEVRTCRCKPHIFDEILAERGTQEEKPAGQRTLFDASSP
jgi:hypothetical protein